jgi:hypothetical protein
MLTIQKELAGLYPGASTGILIMRDVLNIAAHEKLDYVRIFTDKPITDLKQVYRV